MVTTRIRRRDVDGDDAERRDARRSGFLAAATTVIRRDGAGASMEAIAREAGVTKPILYRVFGDRDGLLEAVGGVFADALVRDLAEALGRDADPKAMLTRAIESYVALIDADLQMYRFLTERMSTVTASPLGGFVEQIARSVAVTIGERLREAGADSGAAEPWAFGIVGMVHLAGDWWVERRTMPRERLVQYLVDLLWDGLGDLAPTEPGGGG